MCDGCCGREEDGGGGSGSDVVEITCTIQSWERRISMETVGSRKLNMKQDSE